jgi:hypothetical protein
MNNTGLWLRYQRCDLFNPPLSFLQARNQSGVSEDALKEFSMMFRHFDKDKTGRLDHNAFKSCLRALGYDLPMVEEPEPEFETILNVVDPNRLEGEGAKRSLYHLHAWYGAGVQDHPQCCGSKQVREVSLTCMLRIRIRIRWQ